MEVLVRSGTATFLGLIGLLMGALVRRCTATNRAGEQCARAPIPGGRVCALHGGKTPQVVAAAKLLLLEGVEPAIARLIRFIEAPPGLCEVCGRSDDTSAIVSAIRTVLDRCDLGPTANLTVSTTPQPAPWLEWMTPAQMQATHDAIEDAKRRMLAGEPKPDEGELDFAPPDDVIDAEDSYRVPERNAVRVIPPGRDAKEEAK